MIIGEAFEILKAAGCVGSQREFSTAWCGCRPSYCSSTLARAATRTPSIGVLLTLYSRIRNHVEDDGVVDPAHQQVLNQLAGQLWTSVMERVSRPQQ